MGLEESLTKKGHKIAAFERSDKIYYNVCERETSDKCSSLITLFL